MTIPLLLTSTIPEVGDTIRVRWGGEWRGARVEHDGRDGAVWGVLLRGDGGRDSGLHLFYPAGCAPWRNG